IQAKLAAANAAPIEIVVEPGDANVELTVSSFPPDENFTPRTIHLPPGHHVILAKANGYAAAQRAIDIADKTPQHIAITLTRPGEAPAGGGGGGNRRMPTLAKYGLVVAGVGVIPCAVMTWRWFALNDASKANDQQTYDQKVGLYEKARIATYALW